MLIDSAKMDHLTELIRSVEGQPSSKDSVIVSSWMRCVTDHHLDPTVLRPLVIVDDHCLRERRDAMDNLLHTARFGLEALYRQVAGLGYVALLTDGGGITVDYIGDETTTDHFRSKGLYFGADWSEQRAGTCGIGTCIATGNALIVHQTDHFDATHTLHTCTAAPIFDGGGKLAAVLDISAIGSRQEKSSQYFALHLVNDFAHRIETANLIQSCRRHWIVKLSSTRELADVATEFVLALDSSGHIVAFNQCARELLASEVRGESLLENIFLGHKFSKFFDCQVDDLTRFVAARTLDENIIRTTANGRALYIQVVPPSSIRIKHTVPAAVICRLPEQLKAMVGEDPAIAQSLSKVVRLINTDMSILVQGETGTGKEFVAKAIHAASARGQGSFVPVNCAAIPESLIESELFGYESGSFTGALAKGKKGLFREAQGGTIFLDEIGDMPLASQTRLLRVLAEREVTPVGSAKALSVDIRVIAATHCDLLELITKGKFREDLYYRLNGAILKLPPLRERSDLLWLATKLLEKRAMPDGSVRSISEAALDVLSSYSWPGNIRELINAMDFACAVATSPQIDIADLPDHVITRPLAKSREEPSKGVTKIPADNGSALCDELRLNGWNVSATARSLGIDRTTLHRRMHRLGVKHPLRGQ